MKKLLLVILPFLALSCSGESIKNNNSSNQFSINENGISLNWWNESLTIWSGGIQFSAGDESIGVGPDGIHFNLSDQFLNEFTEALELVSEKRNININTTVIAELETELNKLDILLEKYNFEDARKQELVIKIIEKVIEKR